MAQGKKSFIAYSDWKEMFDNLPNEVAGELIKHIFAYVNDEKPNSDNYVINALFANIKNTLKRDLNKWDEQREQRSQAGKKSAKVRATKSNDRSISFNEKVRNSTVSVSDSVNVSDNVNVNVKEDVEDSAIRSIKEIVIDYKNNDRLINALLTSKEKLFSSHLDINQKLDNFVESLKLQDITTKKDLDFKSHFLNWARIKKKNQQNNQPTSTLKQTTIEK
jgi:hypothetical protein